jgi:hypothetical protein
VRFFSPSERRVKLHKSCIVSSRAVPCAEFFATKPASVPGQALNHANIVTTTETCDRAVSRTWAERSELRFNKGVEGRAATYFSTRHMEQLADMLSFQPALRFWSNDLLGMA